MDAASAAVLIGALLGCRASGTWKQAMRLTLPMAGFVFVVGFLSLGSYEALLVTLRLFNLLTVSFVFFRSMDPQEMGDGLRKLGLPYAVGFILTTAMRYVPLLGRKIRLIMDAQRSRGMDMRFRIRNLKNFFALLIPLLVQSFLLAEGLALAMESRGFQRKNRTFRRTYKMTLREMLLLMVCLALFIAFAQWEYRYG